MGAPSYDVVIVTYRSREAVGELLTTIDERIPVTIVDNAHDVDGLSTLAACRPRTRWVDGPGTGYAAGANRGAALCERDVVIFVNPDSRPTTEDLDRLATPFADEPDLAIACPLKVDEDGVPEIGVAGWEPSVPRALVHAVGAHLLFPRAGLWAAPERDRPLDVDWLGGCCTAVSRAHFVALGGFDENYFVYSEDVEFGRTVRDAGLGMRVRTDIPVLHCSAGSGDAPTRMLRFRGASMTRYLRRHHPRWRVEGVRLALSAGTVARCARSLARRRAADARGGWSYLLGLWVGRPA